MICSLFFHGIIGEGELNCANNAKINFLKFLSQIRPVLGGPVGDSRLKVKIKSRYDDDHHDPTQKEQNKDTFFREQEHQVKLFGIDIATLGAIHIQGYFACNNVS